MRQNVVVSALQQRFSMICAFHYLQTKGIVSRDEFLICVKFMRSVCPGISGNEDGDALFFRYLDVDGVGGLGEKKHRLIGEHCYFNLLLFSDWND
jgi:hypothetical protein